MTKIISPADQAIIDEYVAQKPTRATSRELVKKIAEVKGLNISSVRAVLIRGNVYISLPKDKNKIEDVDLNEILYEFRQVEECKDYFGPDPLITEISIKFGYGKNALSELYRKFIDLGKPNSLSEFKVADEAKVKSYFDKAIKDVESNKNIEKLKTSNRSGPDGCGLIFIITGVVIFYAIVSNFEGESGKSKFQKNYEVLCKVMGGCE